MKKSTLTIAIVGGSFILATIITLTPEPPPRAQPEPAAVQAAPPAPTPPPAPATKGVTMAQFMQLHDGMTYAQAVAVLGAEGELLSENNLMGIKTAMYQWKGATFLGNMNAMFQNDQLIQRSQFGLK